MRTVRTVVNLGRGLRKRHDVRVRQPLRTVTIVTRDLAQQRAINSHTALVAEELNVHSVEVHADEAGLDITIGVGKIRGVESFGMMASERELELSDEHDGIIELPSGDVGDSFAAWLAANDPDKVDPVSRRDGSVTVD